MTMSDLGTWVGTVVTVISFLIMILIWKSSVDKKLDKIIDQKNTLNYEQAIVIVTIYLSLTRYELVEAIGAFLDKEFDGFAHLELNKDSTIEEFFYREGPALISKSRARLQSLKISDDMTMEQFLNEYNPTTKGGIIEASISEIIKEIKARIVSRSSKSQLKIQAFHLVQKGSTRSLEKLSKDLRIIYRNKINKI